MEGFFLQAKMEDFDNDGYVDLVHSGGVHTVTSIITETRLSRRSQGHFLETIPCTALLSGM